MSFTLPKITYYFPRLSGVLFTWRPCEVTICFTTFFNSSRIHYCTQISLIKIVRRKKKKHFSLCDIGKRGILCPNLKDTWFKICKDNIWLYVLKHKEGKICFVKIGALLGGLLMKDRRVLGYLLDRGFYFFFNITNCAKVYVT